MNQGIHITSEIDPLKTVLLHRPGKELLNLTPDTLQELLFDDIPFLKVAREEHDAFSKLLSDNGVEVVYLEDLMTDVLKESKEIKRKFINQYISEGCSDRRYHNAIYEYLHSYRDEKELVLKTMEGINSNEIETDIDESLADLVDDTNHMLINPMPNLYFTRDPFAMVGNGVCLNRMFYETRRRETIYGEYIFNYHPNFKDDVRKLYDRYDPYHIEGGDILNISEETIVIGVSQRTEANAIEFLAKHIFKDSSSKVKNILALSIPKNRSFMHLDTVLTQVDKDKFTVHPGILNDLSIFRISRGDKKLFEISKVDKTLEEALAEALGIEKVVLIKCGGSDSIAAQREQWNDGSNTLCIAPGVIIAYDRNEITNSIFESYGIKVLTIPSSELSRGRGGPRCMSMPLWREN